MCDLDHPEISVSEDPSPQWWAVVAVHRQKGSSSRIIVGSEALEAPWCRRGIESRDIGVSRKRMSPGTCLGLTNVTSSHMEGAPSHYSRISSARPVVLPESMLSLVCGVVPS